MDEDFSDILDYYMELDELDEEQDHNIFTDDQEATTSVSREEQKEQNSETPELSEEETDYESDSNENRDVLSKAKRGRPVGWRKERNEDESYIPRKKAKRSYLRVEDVSTYMCCIELCALSLSLLVVEKARKTFHSLRITERSQYILDWIRDHSSMQESKCVTAFMIGGQKVCLNAFLSILNYPRSSFYAIRKMYLEEKTRLQAPGRMTGTMGASANYFIMWINWFCAKHADKLPDSVKFHLPCCLTKSAVYEMLCLDAQNEKVTPISYSHMMLIWRKQLTHIKIPKKSRFSQCDVCMKLKDKLATCQDKTQREELIQKRKKHLEQQNAERQKYYKHISKAKSTPSKYVSIILDAMDQEKTSIPKMYETPKSLGNIWKVKINLMGAIVHGYGLYGFFDSFQWSHGAAYTISILVQVLLLLDNIPDTLYIQLDNCPGQNKNRYVLGFLAKLVEENIFKKVKLSFLMVGHRHEDIDQLFSRFSVWCARENIFTLDELIGGFERCSKKGPITGIKTSEVYDFQDWLKLNNIKNHSYPHVFKLTRNENGKAVIKYKKWTTDKEWLSCCGSEEYLIQGSPSTYINKIPPTTEKIDIEKTKHDIQQVAKFYEKGDLISWWDSFFNEMEEEEDRDFDSVDLIGKLKKLKLEEALELTTTTENIINIPELDEPIPEVTIGRARRVISQKEDMKVQDLVLTDTPMSPEDWPQIGQVVELLDDDRVVIQPFWGKKTTTWKPAVRRPKGQKITFTVQKNVIWHYGFNLTPSGFLPKSIREMVEQYEEDNL